MFELRIDNKHNSQRNNGNTDKFNKIRDLVKEDVREEHGKDGHGIVQRSGGNGADFGHGVIPAEVGQKGVSKTQDEEDDPSLVIKIKKIG